MNDEVIIDKIKAGDQSELAQVYKTYKSEFIAWITSRYQCSRDEARELYQVCIVILHDNIVKGKLSELKSSLKTYLFAIGKNKFLELKKSESKFTNDVESSGIEVDTVASWEKEEQEMKLERVESGLEMLGDPCKTILELFYYHDMTMDDIAEHLAYKNRDTAKNLKYKCLNRLRKIFTKETEGAIL